MNPHGHSLLLFHLTFFFFNSWNLFLESPYSNRVFSRDVKAFKIFPRKLPPTYWCPFKARLFCNLHYKTCLWRTIKLPNCLNMQILVILLLKKRYTQKIAYIGIDSCLISGKNYNVECLPPIESIDLISYLVLETSYYTKEQVKAFKCLQAYNQLLDPTVSSVDHHRR